MEEEKSSDQRPLIPASEILAKIERGEDVEYDGVIVEGDLDISGVYLPTERVERTEIEKSLKLTDERKVIRSKITITDSEIKGDVYFGNSHFERPINFLGAEFGKNANFSGAKFAGGDARFEKVKFTGGYAYFFGTEFSGGNAIFSEAEFTGGDAYFWGTKFGEHADFTKTEFTGDVANFVGAKFGGYLTDFQSAKFAGMFAQFADAEFGSRYTYFLGTKFGGHANFFRVKFDGDTNFSKAQFDKELNLNDFKCGRLYITWDSIKDKLVYNGPVYLALIKNFKVIERFSDADDCYYAYRKVSQDLKPWYSQKNWLIDNLVRIYSWISNKIKRIFEYFSWINNYPPITWIHRFTWSKLFDWIGLVSCGYGVKVWPIIIWVLGSVLGFTLLYKLLPESYGGFVESGPSTVTIEALNNSTHILTLSPGDSIVSPSWGDCLYFSFTALTGGTPEGLHPAGLLRYGVMFENVLGYTFLALFVVVLARKLIR